MIRIKFVEQGWNTTAELMITIMLFVHAGISPEILKMNYSVAQLNALYRPYCDVKRNDLYLDRNELFGTGSPFWYRGYFIEPKEIADLVGSTLKVFDVNIS